MSADFFAVGNVGTVPEQLIVGTGDDEAHLVKFRVYFPGTVKTDAGYQDRYGFWREVEIWRHGLGKRVAMHIKKGMRIIVKGQEICKKTQKDGVEYENHAIRADLVAPDLIGIASIELESRTMQSEDIAEDDRDAA